MTESSVKPVKLARVCEPDERKPLGSALYRAWRLRVPIRQGNPIVYTTISLQTVTE